MISRPLIGLISGSDILINNIFYHTSLESESNGDHELLSVTVVRDHGLSQEALIDTVKKELLSNCGIETKRFVRYYNIPKALPQLRDIQYDCPATHTQLTNDIFLAGDTRLNGSLNAAMISGELAATGVISAIEAGLPV